MVHLASYFLQQSRMGYVRIRSAELITRRWAQRWERGRILRSSVKSEDPQVQYFTINWSMVKMTNVLSSNSQLMAFKL